MSLGYVGLIADGHGSGLLSDELCASCRRKSSEHPVVIVANVGLVEYRSKRPVKAGERTLGEITLTGDDSTKFGQYFICETLQSGKRQL
jgi:acyl dehydratase